MVFGIKNLDSALVNYAMLARHVTCQDSVSPPEANDSKVPPSSVSLVFLGLTHLAMTADLLLPISNLRCIICRDIGIKFHITIQLGHTCAIVGMKNVKSAVAKF